jgi:hypothetical protein
VDTEGIKRSLESSGLRCTPQRYAVMAFLMEQNRHPTAVEIFEAVNRMDPRSSPATTYNKRPWSGASDFARVFIRAVLPSRIGRSCLRSRADRL